MAPVSTRWHPAGPSPTLGSYGRFVRRHLLLIVTLTVLGAAVAGAVVATTPPQFAATTSLAVAAQPTGGDLDLDRPRVVSLDTDAALLRSGEVLTRAAAAVEFPGGAVGLRDSIDVSALPNTRVLVVRVTDVDRDRAVRACRAVVEEFLRTTAAAEAVRAEAATAALSGQIDDVLAELALLSAVEPDPDAAGDDGDGAVGDDADGDGAAGIGADAEPPDGVAIDGVSTDDGAALYAQLALLREELRVVSAAATAAPGTVVSAASAPSTGSRPGAAGTLASGLLLGSGAGLSLAGLRTAPPGRRSQPSVPPSERT